MATIILADIMREQLDYLLECHNGECQKPACKDCARLIRVAAILTEPFATKIWGEKQ